MKLENNSLCKHDKCNHDSFKEIGRSNSFGFTEVEYECEDCNSVGSWICLDSENIAWDDPCDYNN
tara:strand:- start:386 stop:580 length:195 start_codon:yes stop_codon:yes gene_type:complete